MNVMNPYSGASIADVLYGNTSVDAAPRVSDWASTSDDALAAERYELLERIEEIQQDLADRDYSDGRPERWFARTRDALRHMLRDVGRIEAVQADREKRREREIRLEQLRAMPTLTKAELMEASTSSAAVEAKALAKVENERTAQALIAARVEKERLKTERTRLAAEENSTQARMIVRAASEMLPPELFAEIIAASGVNGRREQVRGGV